MIDDDEWKHHDKPWPMWLCAALIAGMVLGAWLVAVAITWGAITWLGK